VGRDEHKAPHGPQTQPGRPRHRNTDLLVRPPQAPRPAAVAAAGPAVPEQNQLPDEHHE